MSFRDVRARWRRGLRRAVGTAASVTVVASSLVVAGAVAAAPAAAADPFKCTPGSVYVQSSSELREFAVDPAGGGALVDGAIGSDPSTNGFGISSGGQYAYTVTNAAGSKTLAKHDRTTHTTSTTAFHLNESILRGAVHPITGTYYFATGTTGSGIKLYAWDEGAGTRVQVATLTPAAGSTAFGSNGDMAFSASGQLLIVADHVIYSADIPVEIVESTAPVAAKEIMQMDAGVKGNGIAFGNLGHIFVSAASGGGGTIIEVDVARGEVVATTPISLSPTDMASCTFPNTLTVKKDLPEGRHADTDQFELSVAAPQDYKTVRTTATTTGTAPGLQPDYAGPIFTNQGDVFTLSESAAGTTDLDDYAATLSCEQAGSAEPVPVSGNQVTQPAGALGTDLVCTFSNAKLAPALDLRKTADPASGTPVSAGQHITYTVTAHNNGNTTLDPVEIADDLSDVFANAVYQGDVSTSIDGTEVTSGAASITGDDLAWTGILEPGQVVEITYSVIVNDDAAGQAIANRVTASGTPPGPLDPITPPAVTTEHPVAGFEVTKTADPASGTVVLPGDTITYTVTGTNTGNTVLDPASITDDLSAVLRSAAYNDDVDATLGTAQVMGSALSWTGVLAPDDAVVITYSVTVNDDATGVQLRNTVEGHAIPVVPEDPTDPNSPTIPGEPVTPPPAQTEHPVVSPGFTVAKTASPADGTAVDPGSIIEYTVTGTNTGDTALDPAMLTDSLAGVLAHAAYNDDAEASRGAVSVSGDTLSWTGALAPGQDVVVTYSVTVNADAGGETVRNAVSGSATPQLPEDPSDPDGPTVPGTPIVPPTVVTEHPVNEPGFAFAKSVDPASGTAVDPGHVLTYTLTGTNTGETALNTVDIVDDLSGVLAFATYNADATATINGEAAAAPSIDADELTWSGTLQVGETVTVTYTVTVGPDAVGEVLQNSATGTATPPGGEEITPPPATTENPVNVPGFSVSKAASPVVGTAVDPGSVVTYTLTGVNTGETALDPVVITDSLSGVLGHAAYNGDAAATVGAAVVEAPSVSGDSLSWTGALGVGETVTITYSVTVDGDAGGAVLQNSVTGTATPPGGVPPIETPPAVTEHPVNEPGFSVEKTADPASGTRVDPGSVITYTVTGTNTGETALEQVTIVDDLSAVIDHAAYNSDAAASLGESPAVADGSLSWTGALGVGETVTITYSVTVNGDAGGALLQNTVTGVAVPPGGVELTPPPATTEHPVAVPGFTFEKTADPASGTKIATGSVVTYTLTGVNTGETVLDEVVITDSLDEVLHHAELNGDVKAVIGDRSAAAPVLEGTSLSWTGALGIGETVTITYSVTVADSAAGESLRNTAVAVAVPPGGEAITPPSSGTEHPVLPPLAVTGLQMGPWVLGLIVLLLGVGTLMLVGRRRQAAADEVVADA